jgi:hypothetical protein
MLDIGYVANRGVKLFYQINIDQSHIYTNGFLGGVQSACGQRHQYWRGSIVQPDRSHIRFCGGGNLLASGPATH